MMGGLVSAGFLEVIENHYALALGTPSVNHSRSKANQSQDIWFLFQQSEDFLQTDLPKLLQSGERGKYLQNYLLDANMLLQGLRFQNNQLVQEIARINTLKSQCENALSQANTQYSEAFKANDELRFLTAVEKGKKARSCIAEYMVDTSALQALHEKAVHYTTLISRRAQYLTQNQNLIIQHYEVLKPQLLRQLQTIATDLQMPDL